MTVKLSELPDEQELFCDKDSSIVDVETVKILLTQSKAFFRSIVPGELFTFENIPGTTKVRLKDLVEIDVEGAK